MRALAVLLLIANVLFFVWRFNAQLEDDLAARQRTPPPPPASTPSLALLRELPELPPLREAVSVAALPVAPEQVPDTPSASIAPAVAAENAPAATPSPGAGEPAAVAVEEASAVAVLPSPASIASVDTAVIAPPAADTAPIQTATPTDAASAPATTATDTAAVPAADSAPAPSPAEVPSTPALAAKVPSGVCVRIGPFPKDAEALRASRWLRPRSSRLEIRHDGAAGRPLFGIYLEPRSASEREQNLRDLARQGVRDVLPVRREGMTHAISLGVFSSQENVNRRLAEIEKQGYRPIVVPRRDVSGQRFVEAELAAGYEDPARLPAAELGGAAVKTVNCRP